MADTFTPEPQDLDKLEADLNRLPEAFDIIHQRYASGLAFGWRGIVLEVDAIDKWWYIESIKARRSAEGLDAEGTQMFVIDTSSDPRVIYSDIIERGRTDTDKYPARWPAGVSLERQHDNDMLEKITTQHLDNFLHGASSGSALRGPGDSFVYAVLTHNNE